MRRVLLAAVTFLVAFAIGVGVVPLFNDTAQARPIVCKLTVFPFYYCVESNRCKNPGELYCYQCQGYDLDGQPCLCQRVGCMVP